MNIPVQATQHTASRAISPRSTPVTFHPLGGCARTGAKVPGFTGGGVGSREAGSVMAGGSMHPSAPRDNTAGRWGPAAP